MRDELCRQHRIFQELETMATDRIRGLAGLTGGCGISVHRWSRQPIFGIPLVLWLGYFYTHLGLSFVLAAFIGTPGCEIRSMPEFLGRISGKPSEEHYCPAGFITAIDEWELNR